MPTQYIMNKSIKGSKNESSSLKLNGAEGDTNKPLAKNVHGNQSFRQNAIVTAVIVNRHTVATWFDQK